MSEPRLSVLRVTTEEEFLTAMVKLNAVSQGPHSPRLVPMVMVTRHVVALGIKAVVVQRYIHDPDAMAEYHAYYSRVFADYPRSSIRLHFFGEDPDPKLVEPLDFLDACAARRTPYLGFMTLRNVIAAPVGPTILCPPANTTITC